MTTDRIRILIIQANPPGTERLDSDIEQRNLDGALMAALDRDHFAAPIQLSAARVEDLPSSLRRHQPHILHFIGHGDGAGGLLLNAPDDRGSAPLTATDLAELIRIYQAEAAIPLQLVLLAGCKTAGAAALLSTHTVGSTPHRGATHALCPAGRSRERQE